MSSSLLERFEEYLRVELTRAPSTIKLYMDTLRGLEMRIGKPMEEVTADDLRSLKTIENYKSATIRGWIKTAKQFHRFGVVEGLWPEGAIARVAAPSDRDSNPSRALTLEQAAILLESCKKNMEFRLVYYGLYAGLRIGESSMLTEEHWQADAIKFRSNKSRRVREIPIHPELAAVKERIIDRPRDHSNMQKAKGRLQERVGFPFKSHQLRKTFAATLYDRGVPDEVLKDLLGHKGDVTRLYAPVTHAKRLDAVALLEYPVERMVAGVAAAEPDPSAGLHQGSKRAPQARSRAAAAISVRPTATGHFFCVTGEGDQTEYLYNVDSGEWHLQECVAGVGLRTRCLEAGLEISDRSAAELAAIETTMSVCRVCFPAPPPLEWPERIKRLTSIAG